MPIASLFSTVLTALVGCADPRDAFLPDVAWNPERLDFAVGTIVTLEE